MEEALMVERTSSFSIPEARCEPRIRAVSELLGLSFTTPRLIVTNKRMTVQMQSLERCTGRGGKDAIDHPKNGHDDIINAAAGALVSGSTGTKYRVRCVNGDAERQDGRATEVQLRGAA
jgi:hypothetical protein